MIEAKSDILGAFLLVYAGLFPVINPLGAAPIFLSMTNGSSESRRNKLALQVASNSFVLLLGAMLCGSYVLSFFGITIPAVRVAGGAIVAGMGWTLLSERGGSKSSPEVASPRAESEGFYPLTLPLTVGPGAISVALTLGAHHASRPCTLHTSLLLGSVILALLALVITVYIAYRFASPLVEYLGPAGVNALVKLSAFILVCIGVQIAWGGLAELIGGLASPKPAMSDLGTSLHFAAWLPFAL